MAAGRGCALIHLVKPAIWDRAWAHASVPVESVLQAAVARPIAADFDPEELALVVLLALLAASVHNRCLSTASQTLNARRKRGVRLRMLAVVDQTVVVYASRGPGERRGLVRYDPGGRLPRLGCQTMRQGPG